MGVMMQAFYWDCPVEENLAGEWWNAVRERIPALAAAGVTALWLPPAHKAGNVGGVSMGYDPYDYFDLGEFDQKGGVKTLFGSRQELQDLIMEAHTHGMQVYADMVLNHNNGADLAEVSDIGQTERWTLFTPKSRKFPRNKTHFHPSRHEHWDNETFEAMPGLCHRHPYVYQNLMELAQWLVEEIGFDGFRYDFVKGYGSWLVKSIQEFRYARGGQEIRPFGVGECWDGSRAIEDWMDDANAWSDNPVSAFDFPLRWELKALCDTFGYDLRGLAKPDLVYRSRPTRAVTFVDNHDFRGNGTPDEVVSDKLLAYAFILTHEGYPCVFWKDYFNYGLAKPGEPGGIEALMRLNARHANGRTRMHLMDKSLYVMERMGLEGMPGMIFMLNNDPHWRGCEVDTTAPGGRYVAKAWWSAVDPGQPRDQWADEGGKTVLYAPPRGYAVYVRE